MYLTRILINSLFLLLPFASFAQVLDYVDIHLKIVEKVANKNYPLANAKLKISDYGEVLTNEQGQYTFPYAVRKNVDPEVSIALFSSEHKMLKPLDGSIALDTAREEMFIELLVVNMAKESEAFKKRINQLEGQMARLQSKNELTQRQLDAINNKLLDTIFYFETLKQEMESQIADFENLTEEQQREIRSQNDQIAALESQVDQLSMELEAAMEERYLRKNQYFKDISSNLLGYLRKAKDLRDHLPYISTYFSVRSFDNYKQDIDGYNKQYEQFDNNQLDYLEGVQHYWENRPLTKDVEELFDFLSKGIHYNQIFQATSDVMEQVAKQKPKKAQKLATAAHEDLTVNLRMLEKNINRVLSNLRRNL
jgi:DNA repair exonuclease SbcCD ATPase subunit